jgi:hypothetical protein
VKRALIVIAMLLSTLGVAAQTLNQAEERLVAEKNARRSGRGGIRSQATNCPATPITLPASINGRIKASTCRDVIDTAEDVYAVTVVAGETLTITMRSTDFEVFLYMWHGTGSITTTRTSYHVINGTSIVTATHTFATAGTYLIEAGALWTDSTTYPWTGEYRLTVTSSRGGGCTATNNAVCLQNGRFKVSIDYVNPFANPPRPGSFLTARLTAVGSNPDTALFGFDSAQAVEVVVRIVDARPFAPRFDIYYGGLTDVEYTVTVTDTVTNKTRTYRNTVGQVGGGVDRTTFPAE